MKKFLNISFLLVITIIMASCGEEEIENFSGPYNYAIVGPGSVMPGTEAEFTLPKLNNEDTYTWTVEGPASIVGDASGRSITVSFQSVGDVIITFSNGAEIGGRKQVTVAEVEPAVTASFGTDNRGALSSGTSDTVFFAFAAPLSGEPTLALNTSDDSSAFNQGNPFISGSLGPLEQTNDGQYFAIYTAGEGNGTPEALFQDISTTAEFGGANIDSAFVQLYRVDNIAPLASLSFSDEVVSDSSVVTVTVTFTEEVTFDFTQTDIDSAMYISFSGAGVEAEKDTLEATDDPLVYTYDYTVNGEGNGEVTVELENVVDFAGHSLGAVENNTFTVDNTNPSIAASAVQEGEYIKVSASFPVFTTESGTVLYTVLPNGADAPEEAADFEGGLISSSLNLSGDNVSSAVHPLLDHGDYDAYFIAVDEADNYSDIEKVDLSVN